MTENLPPRLVGDFVERALQGDTQAAAEVALGLLHDGVSVPRITTDLLAKAQQSVGELWERDELTVADEHLVTVSTEAALHALEGAVENSATDGHVLVACAEGEWHTIAAHMFAEQLRSTGLHVTFLGASTPPEDLAELLVRQPVDALVITCSLPLHFMGVTRLVDAAHGLGIPVLAGGLALPGSTDRAVRLGADAGAADLTGAVRVLTSWRHQPPTVRREPTTLPAQALDLEAHASSVAETAFDTMRLRFPDLSSYDDSTQLTPGPDDLRSLVQYLAAAHLVRDDSVFTDFLDWLAPMLRARGVPEPWLIAGLEALLPHVSGPHPAAGRLIRVGVEQLTQKMAEDPADDRMLTEVVKEQDRPGAERAWVEALRSGDPVSAQQAIRRGHAIDPRHPQGTVGTSPGVDAGLRGGEENQNDVLHMVHARQREQAAVAAGALQRDLLFRQVAALLATGSAGIGEALQAVAELAAAAIGDGTLLQTISEDGSRMTGLATAHRTVAGRTLLTEWAEGSAGATGTGRAAVARLVEITEARRGSIAQGDPDFPSWSWGNRYVIAPAAYQGHVHGTLVLFRDPGCPDYDPADLDLLRVVAERLGALLEAERAGARARELTIELQYVNAELQQVNADQSNLLLELDDSELRERSHLAAVVHDDPLQLAVAAMLRLDCYREQLPTVGPGVRAADGLDDIEEIDEIATILASCVDHLRSLLGSLTPPDLSRGLTVALRSLAEATFRGTSVRVETRGPDHVALDLRTTETIYRVLREALVNARKHSDASTVTLDIVEADHEVTLRLMDDGIGVIDASPAAIAGTVFGHLGMSSMRTRAAAVNAVFTIRQRHSGGTVVELVVPRDIETDRLVPTDAGELNSPVPKTSAAILQASRPETAESPDFHMTEGRTLTGTAVSATPRFAAPPTRRRRRRP